MITIKLIINGIFNCFANFFSSFFLVINHLFYMHTFLKDIYIYIYKRSNLFSIFIVNKILKYFLPKEILLDTTIL